VEGEDAREGAFMIAAAVAVTILVGLTILIHYEVLRLTSALVPELGFVPPRARVAFVVFACFAAHTIEVWLFALAYFVFVFAGLGSFGGIHQGTVADYVYFSVVTYTSLGFGDVYPIESMRLISGVEALTGLLMIAWSASFTYLAMEQFWALHGPEKWRPSFARRGHLRSPSPPDHS
jgi:ion channel